MTMRPLLCLQGNLANGRCSRRDMIEHTRSCDCHISAWRSSNQAEYAIAGMERTGASFFLAVAQIWLYRYHISRIIVLVNHGPCGIRLTVWNLGTKAIFPIDAARDIIGRNVGK